LQQVVVAAAVLLPHFQAVQVAVLLVQRLVLVLEPQVRAMLAELLLAQHPQIMVVEVGAVQVRRAGLEQILMAAQAVQAHQIAFLALRLIMLVVAAQELITAELREVAVLAAAVREIQVQMALLELQILAEVVAVQVAAHLPLVVVMAVQA
jgi:hypothetical protein